MTRFLIPPHNRIVPHEMHIDSLFTATPRNTQDAHYLLTPYASAQLATIVGQKPLTRFYKNNRAQVGRRVDGGRHVLALPCLVSMYSTDFNLDVLLQLTEKNDVFGKTKTNNDRSWVCVCLFFLSRFIHLAQGGRVDRVDHPRNHESHDRRALHHGHENHNLDPADRAHRFLRIESTQG